LKEKSEQKTETTGYDAAGLQTKSRYAQNT